VGQRQAGKREGEAMEEERKMVLYLWVLLYRIRSSEGGWFAHSLTHSRVAKGEGG
jgi:hypothetical protein